MNNQETVKTEKKKSNIHFRILKIFIAAVILLLVFYFGFTCEVKEGNCAVILRFGAVREEINEAGLYFRLPWPFETVVTYDQRAQYLEANYIETTTHDKRNVILQSYVVWEISDPVLYHNSVGSQGKVDTYINDQVFSATNGVMGAYDLSQLVSLDKNEIKTVEIQNDIEQRVRDVCLNKYGISVSDVSILRISLPDINLQSVFEQMKAERQKEIDAIMAEAQRKANEITSSADSEASQIIADGTTIAATIKAETEAEVAKIYAAAQAENLELYQFLKQLDSVVASVGESTVLVVKADEYPFNVLFEYGSSLDETDSDSVLHDLSYILAKLPKEDREALITSIYALIEADGANSSGGGNK